MRAHGQPFVGLQSQLSTGSSVEILPGLGVTFAEADLALDEYRKVYSPQFPFVPIHPRTPAAELYGMQPFLFRMIVQVVVPQSVKTQHAAKLWFRDYIARHVVCRAEKRLELLQGILLFLAWYGAIISPQPLSQSSSVDNVST